MATFTNDDIEASNKFADSNLKIRILRRVFEKAPHLASWAKVSIRDATHDDYYIPSTLAHASKVVTVEIGEELCKLLSCNPMKEKGPCDINEEASYYYVGDSDYDVQCQPSCFHTATKISYSEQGSRRADVPMLNWHQDKCRIVNSSMVMWLEKTFYRSDTKYEIRVNDMPTGFTRIKSNNPYGAGFTYRTNETYCKYYDRTLMSDGSCDMTVWEKLLDAVVGQTLINSLKSGIRMITNNNIPFELPQNLPKLPDKLEKKYTLAGWKNNINNEFKLPDLIDTKPRAPTASAFVQSSTTNKRQKRNANNYKDDDDDDDDDAAAIYHVCKEKNDLIAARRRAELDDPNMSNFMRIHMGLDIIKDESKVVGLNVNGEIVAPMERPVSHRTKRDTIDASDNPPPDSENEESKHWTEKMKDVFATILRMFTEPETYAQIGIDYISNETIKEIKTLSIKIVEKMSTYLAKGLFEISGSIGQKVLLSGIKGLALKAATGMVLRVGSKIAIVLAKMLGACASIIGWILLGTMLLDLLFSFWDPFGYNNLYPPEIPNVMMENGEIALRRAFASATADYSFDRFASIVLSEDELIQLQVESLVDRIIYLDALVVNSEGARIDKGPEFNVSVGTKNDMNFAQQQGLAERVKWDPVVFKDYNRKFMHRVDLNKYMNYAAAISILMSGIFILTRVPLLCVVFIVFAIIVLAMARLCLQNDLLVDVMLKYRRKIDDDHEDTGFSAT